MLQFFFIWYNIINVIMGGIDMKKILGNLIIILYVVVAIFTTICLLNFNEYKVSEFGDKTLVIIDKDEEGIEYKKGDFMKILAVSLHWGQIICSAFIKLFLLLIHIQHF